MKIAIVPAELKVQFAKMQLKNSLYRLKLLGVFTVIFNVLNWPIYFFRADELSSALFSRVFFMDFCQLLVTLSFFILTSYFSKRNRYHVLWFLCYSFIALHFILSAYPMLSGEIFLILQLFFTGTFLYTFIPDFKPKVFISFLVLWYLTLVSLLTYNDHSFRIAGPQILALNIFLIALIIRILQYNSKVKTFIYTFKINALNEKLEALATTDELTKLNNRRSFMNYMDIIWKQSRRLRTPLSALLIDADYFKKYNDSMGHLEGDKVLIAIAQCMKKQAKRDTDFVARFGGEEFVCLLPYIGKEAATNIAKELVKRVEDMKIEHPLSDVSKYVTISVGLATMVPDGNNSPTQLLDEADRALYSAKHSGRNRVVTQ